MDEQTLDKAMTRAFQAHFDLSPGQEEALWQRFQARRQEVAEWAAFAAAMVLVNARLRSAHRAATWLSRTHAVLPGGR